MQFCGFEVLQFCGSSYKKTPLSGGVPFFSLKVQLLI